MFRVETEDQKQEPQLQGRWCIALNPPPRWTGLVSGFGNATAFGGVGSTSSVCQSISSTNKAIDLGTQTISAGSAVGAKAGTSATDCVQLMYCTQFK